MRRGPLLPLVLSSTLLAAAGSVALVAPGASADPAPREAVAGVRADRPAVVEHRRIGTTREGRNIVAWRLGDPDARRTVVVFSAQHGDELAARQVLWQLRDHRPVRRVDLWVVPTYNPDGAAALTRQNARGVDLNRNFPAKWVAQTGETDSGPAPGSERETRAVTGFLRQVRPDLVISFHQPLYGIGVRDSQAPRVARKLARNLRLPSKTFDCGTGCHGTLSQWVQKRTPGAAITVELGASPSTRYLTRVAPQGLLRAIGARR